MKVHTPFRIALRPIAASLMALALVACGGKSDADLLAKARDDMKRKDYASAVVQLKTLLQSSAPAAEPRYLLGVAMLEQGNPQAALTELRKAEELKFNADLLTPKLARAMLANGKFKDVSDAYDGVKLGTPQAQAELMVSVGVAHALQNRRDKAEAALNEALVAVPGYGPALLTKARMTAAQGEVDAALKLADEALANGAPAGETHLFKGYLLQRGKRDQERSTAAFQEAAKDPQMWLAAHLALFNAAVRSRDLAMAKSEVAEMKKKGARAPQVMLADAAVLMLEKQYPKAAEIVGQLLRAAPYNPQLLVVGGAIDSYRGELLAAEAKLGRAMQMSEHSPVARKMLADVYLRRGQPDKLLVTLRPLLEDAKPDAETLALAGQAHLQKGDVGKAEAMFAAAARLKPQDVQIRTALALTDLVRGRTEAGLDALTQLAVNDPGETADLALITTRMRRGEFDEALKAIDALDRKQPRRASTLHLRGRALLGKGDLAAARKAFEDVLSVEPSHSAALLSLAALDAADGRVGDGKARLAKALQANPKDGVIRTALVDYMGKAGDRAEQIAALLKEGVQVNPVDATVQVAYVDHLLRMKDFKTAVEVAQSAALSVGNNAQVLDALGRALAESGDDMQALSAFGRMAALIPGSPTPHLRMAALYVRKGNLSARIDSLRRAFEVGPESPDVHRQLLKLTADTRDPKVAIGLAKDLQKSRPGSASGFTLEGDMAANRKMWPQAIAAFKQALGKTDPSGLAPIRLHQAYIESNQAAEADRFAAEWIRSHPGETQLTAHLGSVALARKDYAAAERWYGQVLKSEPSNATALNNMAWLLSQRKAPGAVAMAERAVQRAPGNATFLDTLASALASGGQLDRAVDVQAKAVANDPERVEYRLRLAEMLIKAGKRDAAREELGRLSKLTTDATGKARAAELLKSLTP